MSQQPPPPWNTPPAPPSPQQWDQQSPPPPPGWGQPQPGWGAPPPSYGPETSVAVVLAGVALLLYGLLWLLFGAGLLLLRNVNELPGAENVDLSPYRDAFTVIGLTVLVIGLLHVISAIFIWAHRAWARYLGLVLAVLGSLFFVFGLLGLASNTGADPQSQLTGLVFFLFYPLSVIALAMGGRHFRPRGY
jgi:hypothetical protein